MSNTVLMKLEYGSADFSCEQLFKREQINDRTDNHKHILQHRKITNESGCEEQIWGFKERQLEKQQLDSHKKLIIY